MSIDRALDNTIFVINEPYIKKAMKQFQEYDITSRCPDGRYKDLQRNNY